MALFFTIALQIIYQPHPLYPPLLKKERGRKRKRGAKPLSHISPSSG
jgi:hypothetical protein